MNDSQVNPYAAPTSDLTAMPVGDVEESEAEMIRRRYLKHEVSVKSISLLYMLGAVVMGFTAFGTLRLGSVRSTTVPLFFPLFFAGFAMALVATAIGLRRLAGWVKAPVGLLSGLGILGGIFSAPSGLIGAPINLYILVIVFNKKGQMVFSPEYRAIILQTPHVKYKTPLLLKILLVVLLIVLGLACVGLWLG